MSFPTRMLGSLPVTAIGLGCLGMSFAYGTPDRGEALATLRRALTLGVTFLDTADMYGRGHNEELLAEVVPGHRDEIVVATKFGILTGDDGRPNGVDHVDLYYQHRHDPTVPIEDTVGAMAELVSVRKVRHLGLSEASATTIRRAAVVHAIRTLPRFQDDNLDRNLDAVGTVREIADARRATSAQVALAWLLAQGADVVPIPGTKRVRDLEENAGAPDMAWVERDTTVREGVR